MSEKIKVFISYSWDSEEHKEWVGSLADALEQDKRFSITFDQYDLDETNDVFLQATMVSGGSTYLSTTILPNSSRYLFTPMIVEKDPCTNLPWVYDSIVNNYFGFTTISG